MLVSVNLFNTSLRYYFLFIIIPHFKVEEYPLVNLISHGCFNTVFSYKGFYHIWRIALSQHPQCAEIDPHWLHVNIRGLNE